MKTKLDLEEGDSVERMVSLGDRAIIISRKRVYSLRSADSVDPDVTTAEVPWEKCLLLPFGSQSDVVARTVIHINEITSKLGMPQEKVADTQNVAFEVLMCLASMDSIKDRVIGQIDEIEAVIEAEGIRQDYSEESRPIPQVPLLTLEIRTFTFEAKRAVSLITRLFDVLLGIPVKDGHFHKLLHKCTEKYGNDSDVTELLETMKEWIEHVIEYRNILEHPKSNSNIDILNFSLAPNRSITSPYLQINDQKYSYLNPIEIREFLRSYCENCLSIFEEFSACLLAHSAKLPYNFRIFRLQEIEVDPFCPRRFDVEFFISEPASS